MKAKEIDVEYLKKVEYKIQSVFRKPTIQGVRLKDLNVLLDGRGEVTELWSEPWASEGFIRSNHIYQSATDFGVVKCWHLHEIHTDQFVVTRGKIQVTLVDLREDSETYGHVNTIFMGSLKPRLLLIPPMIMHGWKCLSTPEVIVVNLQSHIYDSSDEYKFPWNCVLENVWEPNNG